MKKNHHAALQAAADYVAAQTSAGAEPETIIAGLVKDLGAKRAERHGAYQLRCARLASSCTYSDAGGLLANWTRSATLHLASAAMDRAA